MIPSNLTKFGFDTSSDRIEIESLVEIRNLINENFEKSSTYLMTEPSYVLKGIAERKLDTYIANGDFIAAMILEGFKYKIDAPNAYFNISKRSFKKFQSQAKQMRSL